MRTTLKPIPTRYAGCHFRSRLEARWAVFFDRLDIEWQYEEQGYVVSNRLQLDGLPNSWSYLPDFWLPELGVWAEVKGSLTDVEHRQLLSAAASLSSNDGGGCHDAGGHDVLIFGPVPPPEPLTRAPIRLHMHKGDLQAAPWYFMGCAGDDMVASDAGQIHKDASWLLRGLPEHASPEAIQAYKSARSARFEYGARGR